MEPVEDGTGRHDPPREQGQRVFPFALTSAQLQEALDYYARFGIPEWVTLDCDLCIVVQGPAVAAQPAVLLHIKYTHIV